MPGNYAKGTTVGSAGSRAEIEKTLSRFGCTAFAYGTGAGRAMIAFEFSDRQIRFELYLPDYDDDEFALTPSRKWKRDPESQAQAYEQAVRERWRALALGIKAKLAMVEAGITTFEEEFLAHTVLPDGKRYYDHAGPALTKALAEHTLPALMPGSDRS